jgi:antitoxin component of MazEF toxin-antitoxin module
MPLEVERKIVKIGHSLRMTIPDEIVKALRLREGDWVLCGLTDSTMSVRKKPKGGETR